MPPPGWNWRIPEKTRPLGNESVNGEVTVAVVSLGLLMVMVSVESPPATMLDGLKDSPTTGGELMGDRSMRLRRQYWNRG